MDSTLEPSGGEDLESVLNSASPIRSGVVWNTAGMLAGRVFTVIFGLVLARVLDAKSFGLFGLASAVIAIGLVFSDVGVGAALVQRQDHVRENAIAAFYINFIAVTAFAAAMVAISGPVARFYGQAVVKPLLITMAIGFFCRGLVAVHEAFLRREMRFRRLQTITLVGVAVNGLVAIPLALAGAGPWALAIGALVSNIFYAVAIAIGAGMPMSRHLYRSRWRGLAAFGGIVFVASIVWTLVASGDNLAVGKLLGPAALGIYAMAYNLGAVPAITIGGAVASAMYPSLSRAQSDREEMTRLVYKALRSIALFTMPVAVVALYLARDAILLLLGDDWAAAAVPFQIFVVMFIAFVFVSPMLVVYLAMNRPIYNLMYAVGTLPVLVVAIGVGYRYGVTGVALGVSLMMVVHNSLHVVTGSFVLGVRIRATLRELAPATVASLGSLVLTGAVFWFTPAGPWRTLVPAILAIPVAMLILRVFFVAAWDEGWGEARALLGKRAT